MIVTFCGHGDIGIYSQLNGTLEKKLEETLLSILEEAPDATFYLGDYGHFDRLCNGVLKELQKKYPLLRRIFITPYLDPEYTHLKYDSENYDESLYPFTEKVVKQFAISKRNQWMVRQADIVIAYVKFDWGGAAKTFRYAMQKKKRCINLCPPKNER